MCRTSHPASRSAAQYTHVQTGATPLAKMRLGPYQARNIDRQFIGDRQTTRLASVAADAVPVLDHIVDSLQEVRHGEF